MPNARSLRDLRDECVARIFLFLRRFKPVRERVTLGEKNDHVEREHLARYRFARRYCQGKNVADIACGTGYGMKILGEVAASVDGYDRVMLGGNLLIDLETQSWERHYDVVVSFETIEHLANPEFFLINASKTAELLIVSTPIGEFRGYNPFHKQVWTKDKFTELIEKYFVCQYFYQDQERIDDSPTGPIRFLVAVGRPRDGGKPEARTYD